jgi:hypothetical protein
MQGTDYPATLIGYFDEIARAQAAHAEAEGLSFGTLEEAFDHANIFVRQIEDQETAESFFERMRHLFDENHDEAPIAGKDDAAVVLRGDPDKLDALGVPLLQRHGAREIKRYGPWEAPHIYHHTIYEEGTEQVRS